MSAPWFVKSTPVSIVHPKSKCVRINQALNLVNVNTVHCHDCDTGVWGIFFTFNETEVVWGYTSQEERDLDYERITSISGES